MKIPAHWCREAPAFKPRRQTGLLFLLAVFLASVVNPPETPWDWWWRTRFPGPHWQWQPRFILPRAPRERGVTPGLIFPILP